MAYAQLNAIKVRDAARSAMAEVQARLSGEGATGQDRADLERCAGCRSWPPHPPRRTRRTAL